MRVWMQIQGSQVRSRPVPYFHGDWSWNNFYGHSPPFRWQKKIPVCKDPYRVKWAKSTMHARIQGFSSGGSRSVWQKKPWQRFFFFFFFLVLSLFYRSQMVNFEEIYHFSRFQRGSNIFQGGSNCLFPIETHITCDFPPLWIRTCNDRVEEILLGRKYQLYLFINILRKTIEGY